MNHVGYKVSAKWQPIGSGLGLSQNDLSTIQLNHAGNPQAAQACMRVVIQQWYSAETSEFSWQNLADVLVSAEVNERRAVRELHEKLSQSIKQGK